MLKLSRKGSNDFDFWKELFDVIELVLLDGHGDEIE